MRNIPIDLLRTFVTVIDLDSHTRAGERLGRSQPTISLQLKRLQELVGAPLFDRESGTAEPTETGQMVAGYARRILALNDEMVAKLARRHLPGRLVIGLPDDYADHVLTRLLEDLGAEGRDSGFEVICDISFALLEGLREGRFDLVVAMTTAAPAPDAFAHARERIVWVGRPQANAGEVLRLVAAPEGCLYRRQMLDALQRAGRAAEIVYTSPSLTGREAAIASGFGISAMAARTLSERLAPLTPLEGLPQLGDAVIGVYVGKGPRAAEATALAAHLAELMGSLPDCAAS